MAFLSFIGRVLFVSVFILSAWQEYTEFGEDGGVAAATLKPKFSTFSDRVLTQTGIQVPSIQVKHLVATSIILKGIGSLLFIFGSAFGAVVLFLYQAVALPVLYDFYNYDVDDKEFTQLFVKFAQVDVLPISITCNLALVGALLFFIGMKNSIPRRQAKKKVAPKAKAL